MKIIIFRLEDLAVHSIEIKVDRAYLNALGGRPVNEVFPNNCRLGSLGVTGRRVEIKRVPETKIKSPMNLIS